MPELTAERLREVLRYDADTGVFYWRVSPSKRAPVGAVAGSHDSHRISIGVDGVRYQAHALAWLYIFGEWSPSTLKHKNGNPHDNRIANLLQILSGKPLTAERLRDLLHYDSETGVFTRKVTTSPMAVAGDVAGSADKRTGRASITVDGHRYLSHRLAWLYMTGFWPSQFIDHIDGDPLNNRFENLRDVPQSMNMQNQRNGRSGTSQYLGVCWDARKNLWLSQIKQAGKNIYLGHFGDEEAAHVKYVAAKRSLHPGCTI